MTEVPIRCVVTIILTCDIDVTEKATLKKKVTKIVEDLKVDFPEKIIANKIHIKTEFAEEDWSV